MKIEKLEFQNIKSYGMMKQVIEFNDDWGLILLSGKNGSGKSTIKNVMELSLYNRVPGKRKKYTPNKLLPNNVNKNLYVNVKFYNNNNDKVEISKFIEPTKNKIVINGNDETDRFKNLTEKEKIEILDYDYDTFNSFISMSLNDFKDFITLKNSEKNNILNNLSNYGKLNSLISITTDLLNQNKIYLKKEIESLNINKENKDKLENILNSFKEIDIEETNKLKETIENKISEYNSLKNDFKNIESKLQKYLTKINNYKKLKDEHELKINNLKINIENQDDKLNLFNNEKCPYCNSLLNDNYHINIKTDIKNKKEELQNNLNDLNNELSEMIIELSKEENIYSNMSKEYKNNKEYLINLKNEIYNLKEKYNYLKKQQNNVDFEKLKNEKEEIEQIILKKKKKILKKKKENEIYSNILKKMNDSNLKNKIVKDFIKPINSYIKYFSKESKINLKIEIDDKFNAKINGRNEIDPELLSAGEDKKINIIIALSYLSTLLDKNHTNVLFIDELFNSIDKDNIDLMLKIFKNDIAKKYKINVILIHHYLSENVNKKWFNKIIEAKKNNLDFSELEIKNNK